ncbi:cuticle collagen 2-like [Felis catus]|uniref:cuticle collagen 2-like n=1 Tax=Felis catus TaxID=9685 RepID=UPI001D19D7A8|nr:cuticle collagen 2-like [Felis catus]
MLGSGARCPRLRRPPALALPPPPPSPRRRPAPPGPSRDQRAGDGPALPAGSRGLRGGGPAGEGTRGAGRGDREGPSRLPAAALRRRGDEEEGYHGLGPEHPR